MPWVHAPCAGRGAATTPMTTSTATTAKRVRALLIVLPSRVASRRPRLLVVLVAGVPRALPRLPLVVLAGAAADVEDLEDAVRQVRLHALGGHVDGLVPVGQRVVHPGL